MRQRGNLLPELVEDFANKIIEEKYGNDKCKPTIIVSQLRERNSDSICITLTHGFSQSGIIGYETNIRELIEELYNRTM